MRRAGRRAEKQPLDVGSVPYADVLFPLDRAEQRGLQHDAPRLDGDQVLVARAKRRVLGEPVELVPLGRAPAQQVGVHVGGFVEEDPADGAEDAVRLDGLGCARPGPVEEVGVEVSARVAGVLFEDGGLVAVAGEEECGGAAALGCSVLMVDHIPVETRSAALTEVLSLLEHA